MTSSSSSSSAAELRGSLRISFSSQQPAIINGAQVVVYEDYVSLPARTPSISMLTRNATDPPLLALPASSTVAGTASSLWTATESTRAAAAQSARVLYNTISVAANPSPLGVFSWLYSNADDY